MKHKTYFYLISAFLCLMLCACGSKDLPAGERTTLADLIPADTGGIAAAPTPAPVSVPSEPEEVEAPPAIQASPTPTPLSLPKKIRDSLAPDLVWAKCKGNNSQADDLLGAMREIDSGWAGNMEEIMKYWERVNSPGFTHVFDISAIRDDVINNGMDTEAFTGQQLFAEELPDDDSLCFVIAGFELNNNGTPKKEMIDRLVMGIGCAQKYPHAYILLTGGPTALGNPGATEADVMADWLEAHGVDRSRLIVENRSTITYENAIFAYDILQRDHPQIRELAIVSSDYHIPLCCILFEAQCLLNSSINPGLHVIANTGCVTTGYYFTLDEQSRQLIYLIAGMPAY